MNRRPHQQSSAAGSWFAAIVLIAAIAAGAFYLFKHGLHPSSDAQPVSPMPPLAKAVSAPAPASTAPIHPIAQAESGPAPASTAPLPPLADSDGAVLAALAAMVPGGDARSLLMPSQLISRTVATVDALPRRSLGSAFILPLHTPKGTLVADTSSDGSLSLGAANSARYAPYMAVLANVDPHALVTWYHHNYALFQQAYRELGYPHGYFNDRLILAIDDMLAAPEPKTPPALLKQGSRLLFADPQLQGLSNGQKLMLRMGAADEEQFKAKLRMIRELLIGQQVAH